MRKVLVALALLAVPASAQVRRSAPEDTYYAYSVRTTIIRKELRKSPTGPVEEPSVVYVTESGPFSLADGLERSRVIRLEGVCRVTSATLQAPGRALCYPPHQVHQVEVYSPS